MSAADWTAVAACATAILAFATGCLAWMTRTMVNETKGVSKATLGVAQATLKEANAVEQQSERMKEQMGISAEALRASVQPWLVWQPHFEVASTGAPMSVQHGAMYMPGIHPALEVTENSDSVDGWFTVRNVGPGIAILSMADSYIYPQNGPHHLEGVHPSVVSPVLAPGESVDIEFTIPASKSPDQQRMTIHQLAGGTGDQLFAIEIAYGDSLAKTRTSAKYLAHRNDSKNKPWSVVTVEYRLPNPSSSRDLLNGRRGHS